MKPITATDLIPTTSFLDLPPEIRLHIYCLVFPNPGDSFTTAQPATTVLNFLSSCRTIYAESRPFALRHVALFCNPTHHYSQHTPSSLYTLSNRRVIHISDAASPHPSRRTILTGDAPTIDLSFPLKFARLTRVVFALPLRALSFAAFWSIAHLAYLRVVVLVDVGAASTDATTRSRDARISDIAGDLSFLWRGIDWWLKEANRLRLRRGKGLGDVRLLMSKSGQLQVERQWLEESELAGSQKERMSVQVYFCRGGMEAWERAAAPWRDDCRTGVWENGSCLM